PMGYLRLDLYHRRANESFFRVAVSERQTGERSISFDMSAPLPRGFAIAMVLLQGPATEPTRAEDDGERAEPRDRQHADRQPTPARVTGCVEANRRRPHLGRRIRRLRGVLAA